MNKQVQLSRHFLYKGFILSLCLLMVGCSSLFFYPSKEMVRTPADVELAYEDVYLKSADGAKLNAWFLPVNKDIEVKGTVYFLHGNAQNISHHLASVYWLPEQGYQVLLLDYRGYGNSEGTPLIPDVFMDIEAGFDYLFSKPEVTEKPIYVLGQSLGAAMTGYVVATNPEINSRLSAVILDAGFTSYADISQHIAAQSWLTWLFQYPVAWSMPSEFDLIDVVERISPTPLLIVHGKQDTIIPYNHGEQLFAKAKHPKAMLNYNGSHIATFNDVGNQQLLLEFMTKFSESKS